MNHDVLLRHLVQHRQPSGPFQPPEPVRLIRRNPNTPEVPVGAWGCILSVELRDWQPVYCVQVSLSEYHLTLGDLTSIPVLHQLGIDPGQPMSQINIYVGPEYLEAVP